MADRNSDAEGAAQLAPARRFVALVIDDDSTTRLMLRVVLEGADFAVAEAADGVTGLDEFDRVRPDIVLLDVMMPGMDGYAVCDALRTRPGGNHLPVLVMTGLDDSESVDRAYLAGATDFIAKPISWPVLVQRMRYMLRASRAFLDLEQSRSDLAGRVLQSQAFAERTSTLLKLFEMEPTSREADLLAYGLEQAERLTDSRYACVYLVDDDQQSVCYSRWASKAGGGRDVSCDQRYPIAQAGIWTECAADKQPAILNDCRGRVAIPGGPGEDIPVVRLVSVPVVEEGRVRMILGVANKNVDYDQFDAETAHLIGNDLWRIVHRARAGAKLRSLSRVVQQSPVSIIITDKAGNIEYVNPAFTAVSGYTFDEVRGRNPRLLQSNRVPRSAYEQLWNTITRGGEWRGELCNRKKSGELYWEQASICGLVDEAGAIVQYFAVKEDITERKRMEAEIRGLNVGLEQRIAERTAELERANRELDAFSYSISHDLRAPLRAVGGFSEILWKNEASKLSAHGQELFARILHNCSRMGQMIDDLLRLARLGRGALELHLVDLNSVVAEALRPLAAEYPGTSVDIASLPCVTADAGLIGQVFQNLLGNAFKYSAQSAAPRVTVTVESVSPEATFCVRDNGVGFDMNYAARLFTVFQRLHDQSEFPGTGVGLAIVQRIVERHGGRVWALGAPNQGAAFYFTLPSSGSEAARQAGGGVACSEAAGERAPHRRPV